MSDRIFLDTNILVYCFDEAEPAKHEKAVAIFSETSKNGTLVISTQVLQEVINVFAKKKKYSEKTVAKIAASISAEKICEVKVKTIVYAMSIMYKNCLSFWDALIVSVASESGCSVLFTEDLNAGQIIEGVRIENPLL